MGRALSARNLIISALATVAIGLLVYAFATSRDVDPPARLAAAIESVSPAPGTLALRQDTIMADLAPGYTGVLRVGAVEIPEDQLLRTEGLNQVSYTPGEETETGPLSPGAHRVTVTYWLTTQSRDSNAQSFSWQFTVH